MRRKKRKRRKMRRIKLVTSFTEDIIDRGEVIYRKLGGPGLYGGYVLHVLGREFSIVTRPSREILTSLAGENYGFIVERVDSRDLCDTHFVFKHVYRGGVRVSYLLSRGCEINLSINDHGNDSIYIISPVFKEISTEDVRRIIEKGYFVGVDIQGFARIFNKDNLLGNYIDENILRIFRGAKVFHGGLNELISISTDPFELTKLITKIIDPDISIVSMGRDGSVAYVRGRGIYRIYSYRGGVNGDETGCGDILLISTISFLEEADPLEAILKATLISGLRVERGFPFEIDEDLLDKHYARYIQYRLISW